MRVVTKGRYRKKREGEGKEMRNSSREQITVRMDLGHGRKNLKPE